MPNLTPTSSFDDVPELETNTLALGGPGGPMNLPAQALLNRTQWLKDNAVAGSSSPYAVGTGTANACAAAYTPAITALADGMKLRFLAAATNTGAATFAPDALTAQPIVGGAYAALQGGEILAGGEVELTWNATLGAWVITAQAGGSPQVPDATKSKQSASKGQVDQVYSDLASTASGKGAALIGFLQSGTGAVARTIQDKSREFVSVKDFGAKGDGVTNDTAAIQAAVNATTGALYFPPGVYLCGQVNISQSIFIYGTRSAEHGSSGGFDGAAGSKIVPATATTSLFVIDTGGAVTLKDLWFRGNGQTAGSAITIKDSSPQLGIANLFSSIESCIFDGMYQSINIATATNVTISQCMFWNIVAAGAGMVIDNTYNKDQGGQNITGCTFMGPIGATGIIWQGGGGTRIIGNTFLLGKGIVANFTNATANPTAQFTVAHNAFDMNTNDTTAYAINMFVGSGTVGFSNIQITSNLFISYGTQQGFVSVVGIAAALITQVNITGNNFINTGGPVTTAHVVVNYLQNFSIQGNLIAGNGTSTGVNVGANCSIGSVLWNEIDGVSTPISNSSAGVRVRGANNSGATASVADGGTITHNLGTTPTKVLITGSVAAQTYTVFNVTSTQFSVSVRNTSGSSGTAATIYWQVEA